MPCGGVHSHGRSHEGFRRFFDLKKSGDLGASLLMQKDLEIEWQTQKVQIHHKDL